MSAWESVFLQSHVNDGYYDEGRLPQLNWDWPKGTWFQSRLSLMRERKPLPNQSAPRTITDSDNVKPM